ncbi:MAG: hypothetical protein ABW352_03820 [Polyangiales bacterium]
MGGCAGNNVPPIEEDAVLDDAGTEIRVRTLDAAAGEFADIDYSRNDQAPLDAGVQSVASDAGFVALVPEPTEVLDAGAPTALVPLDAGKSTTTVDAQAPASCNVAGKWAVELRASVGSAATQFTTSSGEARTWLLLDVTGANGSFRATTRVCGVQFPSIELKPEFGVESYQLQFPRSSTSKFADGLPAGAITLRSSGNDIELDAFAVLLGVKSDHKASDAWPADGNSVQLDADSDGKPGTTVTWATGSGKFLPPLDLNKASRARDTQLSARVVLGATKLSGCDAWSGSTGSARVDTHVLGCTRSDGQGCSAEQTGILQTIRPQYSASKADLEAVRLGADARCTDVLDKLD